MDTDTGDKKDDFKFFDIFPKDIFGPIPDVLSKLIVDSGFDRLVTFATLTSDDINTLDTESTREPREPLKLGYRRLLTQMVDFAKKKLIKLESDRVKKRKIQQIAFQRSRNRRVLKNYRRHWSSLEMTMRTEMRTILRRCSCRAFERQLKDSV